MHEHNIYLASLKEKIELFEEMIGHEIEENDILINRYQDKDCSQF